MKLRSITSIAFALAAALTFVPGVVSASAAAPEAPTWMPDGAPDMLPEGDATPDMLQEEPDDGPGKYMATGTHTCQSKDSIGHTCRVSGAGFPTCVVARMVLAARSCCGSTEYGGVSIGFELDSCN